MSTNQPTIYLEYPGLKGDVSAKGFENLIQVSSADFGIARNFNTQIGGTTSREATTPNVKHITLTMRPSSVTPHFFIKSATGKADGEAKVHFVKSGDQFNPFLTLTLSDVIVTGYDLSQAKSENIPEETIQLNFTKIESKFTPYDAEDKPGSPIPAAYDLTTGTAA